MCQFIESIRIFQGQICHVDWHQKRVIDTFINRYTCAEHWDLASIFENVKIPPQGEYKLRMVYDSTDYQIQIKPYVNRPIQTIGLLEKPNLKYPFKSTDREQIDIAHLYKYDDIIFTQNGNITDSSFANLCFLKNNRWFTPNTFLLNGTTRQRLLQTCAIESCAISAEDLKNYSHFCYINAMIPLGSRVFEISRLQWV